MTALRRPVPAAVPATSPAARERETSGGGHWHPGAEANCQSPRPEVPSRVLSRVVLVAAVSSNGVIGRDGRMPWDIPEDLRHFRAVTTGRPVVMGRVTFESIGRPLPRRTNIVVTRQADWAAEGVLVAHSLEEALVLAGPEAGDVMVIGGGHVYAEAMPLAQAQILTEVHVHLAGDTHYPAWDPDAWVEVRREPHEGYDFVWWERR